MAVSNPSPNRRPSGYMCKLCWIMANIGRKSRARNPRSAKSRFRSSSTYGAPLRTRTKTRYTARRTVRLMNAMANKKPVETSVPITPPMLRRASTRCCSTEAAERDRYRPDEDNGRMSQGKHESDSDWLLAFLHQLASHVIDGRDVIRVYGMPQAQNYKRERKSRGAPDSDEKQ